MVLVSNTVWERFRCGTGSSEPYILRFTGYDKETAVRIMQLDCPSPELQDLYRKFADILWQVFNSPCRDVCELRHLAVHLFPKYYEPVKRGEIDMDNSSALFRAFNPHLKTQLRRIYLRETSTAELDRLHQEVSHGIGCPSTYFDSFVYVLNY